MLFNTWLRIMNSDIEVVCVVNFDAITVNDYIGNSDFTMNTTSRRECTTGYKHMIINSSSSSKNWSRARPIVVDDTDPMSDYIDPSVKFKIMCENYVLIHYRLWEERNPDEALRTRHTREIKFTDGTRTLGQCRGSVGSHDVGQLWISTAKVQCSKGTTITHATRTSTPSWQLSRESQGACCRTTHHKASTSPEG